MGLLKVPRRRIRANFLPDFPVEIDWKNPDTAGLVVCTTPKKDYISGASYTLYGAAALGVGERGRNFTGPGASGDGVEVVPSPDLYSITTDFTVASLTAVSAFGSYSHLMSVPYNAASWAEPFGSMGLQSNIATGNLRLWGAASTNTYVEIIGSAATAILNDGLIHWYAAAKDASGGVLQRDIAIEAAASAALTSSPLVWNTRNPVNLLNRNRNAAGEAVTGKNYLTLVWKRRLSNDALLRVQANPSALFKPANDSIWIPVSAGAPSGIDLSATFGALAASSSEAAAVAAAASVALGSAAVTAAGTSAIAASQSVVLGALAANASASAVPATTASLSVTLGTVVVSGAETAAIAEAANAALGAVSVAATESSAIAAAQSIALGSLTASASASSVPTNNADLTQQLGALSASAVEKSAIAAVAAVSLGGLSMAAAASVATMGSASVPLGAAQLIANGSISIKANAAVQMGAMVVAALAGQPVVLVPAPRNIYVGKQRITTLVGRKRTLVLD